MPNPDPGVPSTAVCLDRKIPRIPLHVESVRKISLTTPSKSEGPGDFFLLSHRKCGESYSWKENSMKEKMFALSRWSSWNACGLTGILGIDHYGRTGTIVWLWRKRTEGSCRNPIKKRFHALPSDEMPLCFHALPSDRIPPMKVRSEFSWFMVTRSLRRYASVVPRWNESWIVL